MNVMLPQYFEMSSRCAVSFLAMEQCQTKKSFELLDMFVKIRACNNTRAVGKDVCFPGAARELEVFATDAEL